MAQNEVAKATIEVTVLTVDGKTKFEICRDGIRYEFLTCMNRKPLNPAAEAMLNPKNEVEEIAKRLNATLWHGDETQWEHISSEYRETWYGVAREVCRMKADELGRVRCHHLDPYNKGCGKCNRIIELEEMAKGD